MKTARRQTNPLWSYFFVLIVVAVGVFVFVRSQGTDTPSTPTTTVMPKVCERRSVDEQIARADLIVVGTVFAVVPDGDEASVLIDPLETYKGTLPETGIRIAALDDAMPITGSSVYTDELHFTSSDDASYLLYLRDREDGKYLTSVCDGSRLFGDGLTDAEQDAIDGVTESDVQV